MSDFEKQRDEQLINEREEYEKQTELSINKEMEEFENSFLDKIVENMLNSDEFDKLMAERLDYINDNFDFEPSPAYEGLEEIYHEQYESKFRDNENDLPNDYYYPEAPDGSSIEGYDYPEGYNDGDDFRYAVNEPNYCDGPIEYEPPYELEAIEDYYDYLIDNVYEDNYEDTEELHIQKMIKEHLQEEKDYLQSIVEDVIQEEYFVPEAIDQAIFDSIDIEYDRRDFDYEDTPQYWYDKPDPSTQDPFDSFDEIDYPEGYVEYTETMPGGDDFDMAADYAKFRKQKLQKTVEGFKEDMIPEPPNVIAFTKKEEMKFKSHIKDYFRKDKTLDKIIKEKIREKKFK